MDVADVRADLLAEQADLDAVLAGLTSDQWALATPSPRWSVADQIGHLAFFDESAALAINDPDGFTAAMTEMLAAFGGSPEDADNATLGPYRAMDSAELLEAWRTNRSVLADAAANLTNDDRVLWYGPSMGSKSFLTARLMEAWAHGQDIVDTVGAERQSTDRLKHIAQLGFITRGWTYINRKLEPPTSSMHVQLTSPSGETWEFGESGTENTVFGAAEDFCQVVTQRRHVDDTGLVLEGADTREWLEMAQAFAGGVTDGPAAGSWN